MTPKLSPDDTEKEEGFKARQPSLGIGFRPGRDGEETWKIFRDRRSGRRRDNQVSKDRKIPRRVLDSNVQRSSTVSVLQEVKAAGLTVSHVRERYQSVKKEVDSQVTTTPMPYEDVVKEFVRRKLDAKKTERYVENTRDFLMRFGSGRERQNLHEIPASDLKVWLAGQNEGPGLESVHQAHVQVASLSSFWSVAIAKGWAKLNIVDRLEPVTVTAPPLDIYGEAVGAGSRSA